MKLHANEPIKTSKPTNMYLDDNPVQQLFAISREAAEVCRQFDISTEDEATKEVIYLDKYSEAMRNSSGKSKEVREAQVFEEYKEELLAYKKAKAKALASLEKLRTLRQRMSAIQTILNHNKEEISLYNYGQEAQD